MNQSKKVIALVEELSQICEASPIRRRQFQNWVQKKKEAIKPQNLKKTVKKTYIKNVAKAHRWVKGGGLKKMAHAIANSI